MQENFERMYKSWLAETLIIKENWVELKDLERQFLTGIKREQRWGGSYNIFEHCGLAKALTVAMVSDL